MSRALKIGFLILIFCSILAAILLFPYDGNFAVLSPKGWVALREKKLLITATLLMLIVVVPVLVMTVFFAFRYRATQKKAKYQPEWSHSTLAEVVWWGFPFLIIVALSILTWKSSHELDPYKPLESSVRPLEIQVVALQWKWLFIYPEQKIATVNFVQFPENTPINFEITSDAPMNSFWIPQLGGQIYAMSGMRSKLHLIAHEAGDYRGSSANISGKGFSGMVFLAKASSQEEFEAWASSMQRSSQELTAGVYEQLVLPSENTPATFYVLKEDNLFDGIIMKYE
jgi:cytochrome o ubiquinol oxidase subunit 2